MVTEWVITLPTKPTEGEIVKSHPLFSFINIGQRGRNTYIWHSHHTSMQATHNMYIFFFRVPTADFFFFLNTHLTITKWAIQTKIIMHLMLDIDFI